MTVSATGNTARLTRRVKTMFVGQTAKLARRIPTGKCGWVPAGTFARVVEVVRHRGETLCTVQTEAGRLVVEDYLLDSQSPTTPHATRKLTPMGWAVTDTGYRFDRTDGNGFLTLSRDGASGEWVVISRRSDGSPECGHSEKSLSRLLAVTCG
jgi:hypothetical protein